MKWFSRKSVVAVNPVGGQGYGGGSGGTKEVGWRMRGFGNEMLILEEYDEKSGTNPEWKKQPKADKILSGVNLKKIISKNLCAGIDNCMRVFLVLNGAKRRRTLTCIGT